MHVFLGTMRVGLIDVLYTNPTYAVKTFSGLPQLEGGQDLHHDRPSA